jgi:hypothetical protein
VTTRSAKGRRSAPVARQPLLRSHGLGLGYHAVFFQTEVSDRYALHGPSVAYDYFVGRRWGFMLRLAGFVPLLGSMHGPSGDIDGALPDMYEQHLVGLDSMAMVAQRKEHSSGLALTAAFGAHLQWTWLASTEYSNIEVLSLGVGGLGKVDYAINGWLSSSAQLAWGLDFLDLIDHKNPALLVVPLSCSFAIAARY